MKLNKEGYQQLINEDIAWLEKLPYTLEREHIIAVLKCSVEHEYPSVSDIEYERYQRCYEHGELFCDCGT